VNPSCIFLGIIKQETPMPKPLFSMELVVNVKQIQSGLLKEKLVDIKGRTLRVPELGRRFIADIEQAKKSKK
jgi:hypothetical protein